LGEALSEVGLTGGEAEEAVGHLEHEGRLVRLGEGRGLEGFVTSPAAWAALLIQMREALGAYHQLYPLRAGMPREELRNRLGLEGRAFAAALAHAVAVGEVEDQGAAVSLPEHKPSLTGSQQADVDSLNSRFKAAPYAPPSLKECQEAVDAEVLAYLFDSGRLVQVSPDVVFDAETYREMVDRVRQEIRTAGTITVARVRDLFATSRKYALALMEHLDAIGITVRVGDERRLANG
jgi:selenocysteine-specific elongation factor